MSLHQSVIDALGVPDFTGFDEPTLSVLQQAWADFLASGAELAIVSDPDPKEPDWTGFNNL